MPYQKRYNAKKNYRNKKTKKFPKRKNNSYRSRLADKKINTLVEYRAKEIAIDETRKAIPYYSTRGLWLMPGANWPGNDIWPPRQDSLTMTNQQFFSREIAKVGGYLKTELSDEVTETNIAPWPFEGRDMYIHIKEIKLLFRFTNQTPEDIEVDICLWRVPYNKFLLAADAQPDATKNPQPQYMWHPPFTFYNTISSHSRKLFVDQDTNMKATHQRLAHKRIKVRASPYMLDDPAGGGGNRINVEKWYSMNITKTYANLGRKEKYQIETSISPISTRGSLSDNRYYYTIRSTGTIQFQGVTSVMFCRGEGTPETVLFDEGAPAAG